MGLASVNASSARVRHAIFETCDEEAIGEYVIDAVGVHEVHAADASELKCLNCKTAGETTTKAGNPDLPLLGFLDLMPKFPIVISLLCSRPWSSNGKNRLETGTAGTTE